MSVFNNSARTIDGQNTLICDIIEVSEELILNGDNGSDGAIVKSDGVNARWALLTDLLVAGAGIEITGSTIKTSNVPNSSLSFSTISGKALGTNLGNLTAGTNIAITHPLGYNGSSDRVISSTNTEYTAGTGLALSSGNQFSTSSIPNASLSNSTISGKELGTGLDRLRINGTDYTGQSAVEINFSAGTGLSLSGTTFNTSSIPNSSLSNDTISGKALGTNLGNLTAGSNITLSGGYNGSTDRTISSTNTLYTAGTGLSLSAGNQFSTSSIPNSSLSNDTISGKALGTNLSRLAAGTNLSFTSGSNYDGGTDRTINLDLVIGNGLKLSGNTLSLDIMLPFQ